MHNESLKSKNTGPGDAFHVFSMGKAVGSIPSTVGEKKRSEYIWRV